jgi:hypothetical protein
VNPPLGQERELVLTDVERLDEAERDLLVLFDRHQKKPLLHGLR